ncbi:MAG: tetratricopeptide repeat protein [Verrucomicrobia bacterium]|nr:tetratricopeptide repeat protein [Verrucomicrobiota bacterium]
MSRFNNLEFGGEEEDHSVSPSYLKDEVHYLMEAQTAFAQGRFEQALRHYAKVLEFNSKNAAAWRGQVRMLIELGEFAEAKLWADKALETVPDDPELLAAKAVALARGGDLSEAMMFSDAAIEARGETPYVWLARGDVLLARREKRAEFCFEKALGLAGRDWLHHWLISRVYFFYKQFSYAFKLAQQALALDAGRAAVWLQFGRCQLALGFVGAAENSLHQARQLDAQCRLSEQETWELSQRPLWARMRGWWRQMLRR